MTASVTAYDGTKYGGGPIKVYSHQNTRNERNTFYGRNWHNKKRTFVFVSFLNLCLHEATTGSAVSVRTYTYVPFSCDSQLYDSLCVLVSLLVSVFDS